MKTKEEIEQLAEELFIKQPTIDVYGGGCRYGFIKGYTQCQEDIIKELIMHILINEHDWNRNPQAQLKDFINSLSKTKQ